MIESELPSIRIFLLKTALKIGQEKYSLSIICYEFVLDKEKAIGSFYD